MSTNPLKKHSAEMTDGPSRAPARSMLKAIGYTDEDLSKPIIGVATTWIETMPCNYNQRELAKELGFSLGKLNYCIKALRTKGLIKIENFF